MAIRDSVVLRASRKFSPRCNGSMVAHILRRYDHQSALDAIGMCA